jgi:hypothetical protein
VILLVVACTLVALFIGSAEAGYKHDDHKDKDHKDKDYKCNHGYKTCDHKKHGKWCETWVKGDINNCGDCYKKCDKYLPNTYAKCEDYKCVYKCNPGYENCDYNKHNGCETNIYTDVKNCGKCKKECKVTWGQYAEAYCKYGHCEQRCKDGYKYDEYKKCCVKKYDKKHH